MVVKGLMRGEDCDTSGTRDECFAVVMLGSMYCMLRNSSIKVPSFARVPDRTSPTSSAILSHRTVLLTLSGQSCLLSYSLSIFTSCHNLSSSIASFHQNLATTRDVSAHSIFSVDFEDVWLPARYFCAL